MWWIVYFENSSTNTSVELLEKTHLDKFEYFLVDWWKFTISELTVCTGFKLEIVQKVFTNICIDEILHERNVPRYILIKQILSDTIDKVTQSTGQTKFEWLSESEAWSNPFPSKVKSQFNFEINQFPILLFEHLIIIMSPLYYYCVFTPRVNSFKYSMSVSDQSK